MCRTFQHSSGVMLMAITFLICQFDAFISQAQGFLHADGKKIINGYDENVILRGIGTGNWMLMEGYMMKTEDVAGTQHEFEARLIETIGEDKKNEFINQWLANHMTRADVDSLKNWGFNSIRLNMHYKWFTLPVQQETHPGTQTWLLKGFKIIDDLLTWCSANQMYLILDLHAAPGGQGKNANISDYNPTLPSLWESEANKEKTVALWKKIAERYSNNPWIGGYDLLNETNWTFQEANNKPLRDLMERITAAIREVDKNHILFIEGNSYANDFSGLTPPWDNNMAYSFHRYWASTSASEIDWIKWIRETYNVPLWMGESGENSNTWFTDFIKTCEQNNIGWSWWPVKKNGINNVLYVTVNAGYLNLIKYWKGEIAAAPNVAEAYEAVMTWAENHKISNCRVQRDVIDAMIRQPNTNEVIPFKQHKPGNTIFFTDYDIGRNGFAYSDNDFENSGGDQTKWNQGWELRNDGVDIEKCGDTQSATNGYNVSYIASGEWMQYTINADSSAIYTLNVRHASGSAGSGFHLEANGARISDNLVLPATGGWQIWKTTTFQNILLPAGKIAVRFINDTGGSNLSYFEFSSPSSAAGIEFKALAASTSEDGTTISLTLNKEVTNSTILKNDFKLSVNGIDSELIAVQTNTLKSNIISLKPAIPFSSKNTIVLSYNGSSVKSGIQYLTTFSDLAVQNRAPDIHPVPGKIEAEDFSFNNGLTLETCTDTGGGQNTGYAVPGEYLDYRVHVTKTGYYALNYRIATTHTDSELILQTGDGVNFTSFDTIQFINTGGWQNWQTQTRSVQLSEGYYFIRLLVNKGEHNLNWLELNLVTANKPGFGMKSLKVYPNPAQDQIQIELPDNQEIPHTIELISVQGSLIKKIFIKQESDLTIDLNDLPSGQYFLLAFDKRQSYVNKLILNK